MTSNQINYWNLQELKRSNLINEGIKKDTLQETQRSNLIKEGETLRSNLVKERETNRHNVADEKINRARAVTGGIKDVTGSIGNILGFGKLFG